MSQQMQRMMARRVKGEQGFSLIELMIVVAIVGILAAIAIPNFLTYQMKARTAEARSNLGAIRTTQVVFFAENNCFLSVTPQGTAIPASGTRTAGVAWAPSTITLPPAGGWCTTTAGAVGPVSFTTIGFAPIGTVFYYYGVNNTAGPTASVAGTSRCAAAGAVVAATTVAPGGGFEASAASNLDGDANVGTIPAVAAFAVGDAGGMVDCTPGVF